MYRQSKIIKSSYQPKVSIIVPIYKAEATLKKCIESIRCQTLQEIEIILVNDGSPDNCPRICDEYTQIDSRIRVIHNTNSGPSVSRNLGILSAIGEYIGFVDADDYIEPEMYKVMYELAFKNDVQILCCNYYQDRFPLGIVQKKHHGQTNGVILGRQYIRDRIIPSLIMKKDGLNPTGLAIMCNKLYSRKFVYDSQIQLNINRKHGEDWWFNIQLFNIATKAMFCEECLYHYVRYYDGTNTLISMYKADFFDLELKSRYEIKSHFSSLYSLDTDENNLDFIYKSNKCIFNIFNNEKELTRQKDLIFHILRNEEYITCYNKVSNLPPHLQLLRANLNKANYECCFMLLKANFIPIKIKIIIRKFIVLLMYKGSLIMRPILRDLLSWK